MNKIAIFSLLICSFFACKKEPIPATQKYETPVQFEPKPKSQVKVFVQSDSVLMGEKIMPDGSIRKDNFHLDKGASPEDLESLYRAYNVEKISESDNIYLVRTKRLYSKARTFFRIIRFDENGKQVAARTFVDYLNGGFVILDDDSYCALLKLPEEGTGLDSDEKGGSFQILYLDKAFNIIHRKQPCGSAHNEVQSFSMKKDSVHMAVKVYLGCTLCDHAMFYYSVKLGPKGEFYDGKIDRNSRCCPDADSALFEQIKECLSN